MLKSSSTDNDNSTRSVWFMFLGLGVLMVGLGLQGAIIGLEAKENGLSTFVVGLMMFAYYFGLMGGSRRIGRLVVRAGSAATFASMASLASSAVLIHGLSTNPVLWIGLRLLSGLCIGGVTVIAESWIAASGNSETRGSMTAWYFVIVTGGYALGSSFSFLEGQVFTLYVVSSILLSLSVVPILLSGYPAPAVTQHAGMAVGQLVQRLPLGVAAAWVGGFTWSTVASLGTVYAVEAGSDRTDASLFATALVIGSLIVHLPVAKLSDRFDRRSLILAIATVGVGICFISALMEPNSGLWLYCAGLAVGGITAPLYSVAIAYTVDHLDPDEVYPGSVTLLTVSSFGMLLGPLVGAGSIEFLGAQGFFYSLGAVTVVPTALSLVRLLSRTRATPKDRSFAGTIPHRPSLVFTEIAVEPDADHDLSEEYSGEYG